MNNLNPTKEQKLRKIGDNILKCRMNQHKTQKAVAELAGISLKLYRKAERGERLDMETIIALADAFEVSVLTLCVCEDERNEDKIAILKKRLDSIAAEIQFLSNDM